MNLEDFQAQFDEIIERRKTNITYCGCVNYVYMLNEFDVAELYNLCLKALGEL